MTRLSLEEIKTVMTILSQTITKPQIELNYYSDYTLTVAVILSAQSTDKGVNKVTSSLFQIADTPAKMLKIGLEKLKDHIKSLGLYNNKAKNIINMSAILLNNFQGKVPNNFSDLISLPGVGRKSANVILNCFFNYKTIAVDTHVFRTSNRIGLCHANNVLLTEKQLMETIPNEYLNIAHHLLVLHGRYVCKARKPLCSQCCLNKICLYNQ